MKLIKLEADWCAPCKQLATAMKDIPHEAVDVDEDEGRTLIAQYGARSVPTLVLVSDQGDKVAMVSGLKSRQFIDEWLAEHGYTY